MSKKVTYLLPIWIDLTHIHHKSIMRTLNDKLTEFFEKECDEIAKLGCEVEVQWSVNQHVNLKDGDTQ